MTTASPGEIGRFWAGLAAYVLPTFPLAYVWHMIAFAPNYHAIEVYRDDVIIPFGVASMLIQGAAMSWLYPRVFPNQPGAGALRNGLLFGLGAALISWSFTTLAVAAKHVMSSVPSYVALETSFTFVQFAIVGPLVALAHHRR